MPLYWTDRRGRLAAIAGVSSLSLMTMGLSASANVATVLTPMQAAAFAAVANGPSGELLTDPSDVLDMLAPDPFARAVKAETQAARLTGRPIAHVGSKPDMDAPLDPMIAAKIASTFAALGGDRPAPATGSVQTFDFAKYLKRGSVRRSAPRRSAPPASHVQAAIFEASRKSGVSHGYLYRAAARESSFNPLARASTSSATGLYQFIDTTWLLTVRRHGPAHGLGGFAAQIKIRADGSPYVVSDQVRRQILALRYDPRLSADLAAAFTRDNAAYLRTRLGRTPRDGELYIAHFLGAEGAATLLRAAQTNPGQSAAGLMPSAARANPALFYSGGRPRTAYGLKMLLIHKGEN